MTSPMEIITETGMKSKYKNTKTGAPKDACQNLLIFDYLPKCGFGYFLM